MENAKQSFQLTVNGRKEMVEVDPDMPLLYVLRNHLSLYGPKYGCGVGQCGSCMVWMDGRPVLSCLQPARTAADRQVTTLAGLTGENGELHPVQQAFLDEQAAQCGYCTNGMIMAAAALLERNPDPDDQAIRQALQLNLCRCGTQSRVIRAVRRAAENTQRSR